MTILLILSTIAITTCCVLIVSVIVECHGEPRGYSRKQWTVWRKGDRGERYSRNTLVWVGPGGFRRFKSYTWPHNSKVIEEAAASETKTALIFPSTVQKTVGEHGFSAKPWFRLDEMDIFEDVFHHVDLFQITRRRQYHTLEASKDKLPVLLGGNYEILLSLKCVGWSFQKTAQPPMACWTVTLWAKYWGIIGSITLWLFITEYMKKENLVNKPLLITDNVPRHPSIVID